MDSEQDPSGIDKSEREHLKAPSRQGDLSTQHGEGQPAAARNFEYEISSYYTLFIKRSLAEYLRGLGGGEITEGVKIVTRFYRERCEEEK
jgi:hypothetical protein